MSQATDERDAPPAGRTKTFLLTIVGSVAVPLGLELWQETYVRGLTDLGAGVSAARQAVARAVSAGWFTSVRSGRRARLAVSEPDRRGLIEARERVEAFGRPFEWDGEWLIAVVKVPEHARPFRQQLRTQLGWLGFGSLGNGVWVSPHTENEQAVLALFATPEWPGDAYVFRSARSVGVSPEQLAATAWDMDALRARYGAFLRRFEGADPQTPAECWSEWIRLTTSWRHFPLFDPELPEHLLLADWPRATAFRLYHRSDARWRERAVEHVMHIEREIDG